MPSFQKEGAIALSHSMECMSGRITDRISFRLDYTPAQSARVSVMDDGLANQIARQLDAIRWKFRSPETPQPTIESRSI